MRFFVLHLITAPPNYRWQEFLERSFPPREHADNSSALPLHDADRKRESSDNQSQTPANERLLSRWIPRRNSGRRNQSGKLNLKNTIIKWFIDCITLGALMNTTAFLVIMGVLKGQSRDHIFQNLQTQTLRIIFAGYRIWPLASLVSFSFVPVRRRILFFGAVGLCWNVYMTMIAARL
jgi:hypothetical protein